MLPQTQVDVRSDEADEREEAFEEPDTEDADEHDRRRSSRKNPVIDRQAGGEPRQDFSIVVAGGGGGGDEHDQRSQGRRDISPARRQPQIPEEEAVSRSQLVAQVLADDVVRVG